MTKQKKFTFNDKWNSRFMDLARLVAGWSKDTSTKVGCVIIGPDKEVRSIGYNGFPRGVDDTISERKIRPTKYEFTEHAERNAIYNAGLYGARIKDCVLYVTLPPCADCARGIIQSGIREVIYMDMPNDKNKNIPGWREKLGVSFQMFDEAGVIYKSLGTQNTNSITKQSFDLFNNKELDRLSYNLIAVNGSSLESFICVEEINELVKEFVLNNSEKNIAEETADFIITRNHVVCTYDIKNNIEVARTNKLATQNIMQDSNSKIISLLDLQKSLTKYVNRGATTMDDLTDKIATADIAIIQDILYRNSWDEIKQNIDKKIQRTIQNVFVNRGIKYK